MTRKLASRLVLYIYIIQCIVQRKVTAMKNVVHVLAPMACLVGAVMTTLVTSFNFVVLCGERVCVGGGRGVSGEFNGRKHGTRSSE